MYFKNVTNQDVHVLVDRYVKRNDKGQPVGRTFSTWGFIRPGEIREITNEAIRGANKELALQVTTEKPTPRRVAVTPEDVAKLKARLVKLEAELAAKNNENDDKPKADESIKKITDSAEAKIIKK